MHTSIAYSYHVGWFLQRTSIDLIPDPLYYCLFPCHTRHFDGQISIAFNGVNGNGSLFYITHETNKLILNCWNVNGKFL